MELSVGDTVSYISPDGVPTILFKGTTSPFDAPDGSPMMTVRGTRFPFVAGKITVTVVRAGEFECGCNLTLEGGRVIGWGPDKQKDDPSGGIHDVKD
jgi:hypothetical protein